MLKQRILTAIILIPLFLLLLFKLSPQYFFILTSIVTVWAAWEWSGLMGVKKVYRTFIYPAIIFICLVGALWLPIPHVLAATFFWWLFALGLIVVYPKISDAWGKGVIVRGLMGLFVLIPCWLAINFIRNAENGIEILLFLFILIWGADSVAYFAGKKWGKTKLAPLVSPGKSTQGLYGALAAAVAIALIALWWFGIPFKIWFWVLSLSILTVLFSIVGDLFESMLKRRENLKDSGTLLPGHGGILDRIDSLTAAAPIFALGAMLIGYLAN